MKAKGLLVEDQAEATNCITADRPGCACAATLRQRKRLQKASPEHRFARFDLYSYRAVLVAAMTSRHREVRSTMGLLPAYVSNGEVHLEIDIQRFETHRTWMSLFSLLFSLPKT